MRRLLWAAGWVGVVLWSLFAFAAYGLVDLIAGAAMRNADAFSNDPTTVEWLFNLFGWIRSFSTSAVLVVWGLVSLAILAVPWLFDRFTAPPSGAYVRSTSFPPPPYPGGTASRDGVIDLGPGDYTVRGPDGARPGPTPRVGPRP